MPTDVGTNKPPDILYFDKFLSQKTDVIYSHLYSTILFMVFKLFVYRRLFFQVQHLLLFLIFNISFVSYVWVLFKLTHLNMRIFTGQRYRIFQV